MECGSAYFLISSGPSGNLYFWWRVRFLSATIHTKRESSFFATLRRQIKIQQLFADALAPMLTRLKNMQEEQGKVEHVDFEPQDPAESRCQLVCFNSEGFSVAKFRQEHEKKLEVIRQEMETINEVLALSGFRTGPALFCNAISPVWSRHLTHIAAIALLMFEDNILHATRSAGITFAQSFIFLMEAISHGCHITYATLVFGNKMKMLFH